MPEHLEKMLPEVVAGDPTATRVFLAEGLKAKETGKKTSTREMTDTGTWGLRNPNEATAEAGRGLPAIEGLDLLTKLLDEDAEQPHGQRVISHGGAPGSVRCRASPATPRPDHVHQPRAERRQVLRRHLRLARRRQVLLRGVVDVRDRLADLVHAQRLLAGAAPAPARFASFISEYLRDSSTPSAPATATLAAYVGGGGLGRFIADGFGQADTAMTTAGGVLVAALALVVELSLGAVQRRLTPGPRRRRVLPGLDPSLATPSA